MRELTARELETLEMMGDFRPTFNSCDCAVEGWTGDKFMDDPIHVIWNSTTLRRISADLMAIADWLEARAEQEYEEVNHNVLG